MSGNAQVCVDTLKIEQDAKWDGLHGVITNKKINGPEIYEEYRRLWVIEESFRINKPNLKMRPIYPFTPPRIQAPILIGYRVFTLVRHVQFQLAKSGESMSVLRIIEALRNVQASILRDVVSGTRYKLLSALSEDASTLYKAFNSEQEFSTVQLD